MNKLLATAAIVGVFAVAGLFFMVDALMRGGRGYGGWFPSTSGEVEWLWGLCVLIVAALWMLIYFVRAVVPTIRKLLATILAMAMLAYSGSLVSRVPFGVAVRRKRMRLAQLAPSIASSAYIRNSL